MMLRAPFLYCQHCGHARSARLGFYRHRNNREGRANWCAPCQLEDAKRYHRENLLSSRARHRTIARRRRIELTGRPEVEIRAAPLVAHPDGAKTCGACHEKKPLAAFGRRAQTPDGLNYRCQSCNREADRVWRETHRGRYRQLQRESSRRVYYADLPAQRAIHQQRKQHLRARDRARLGIPQMLAVTGGRCWYCETRPGITVDHLTPLTRGGEHGRENVVPACHRCNSSKNDRTPLEFFLAGGPF